MNSNHVFNSIKVATLDHVELDCSIAMPKLPKAITIIAHGSFNQDKDGNLDSKSKWMFPKELPKRNLFIDIEKYLLQRNIGVIRYDKRASGNSGGIYENIDLDVLSSDLNSIILYAKQNFNVPIYVIGQSEGAQTAIYCQHLNKTADGIILQGANFGSLEELLYHQRERAAKVFIEGLPSTIEFYPYLTALYQHMYKPDFLNHVIKSNDDKAIISVGDWSHWTNIKKYRQYGTIKIAEILKSISVPVDIIHGTEDANCNIEYLKNSTPIFDENKLIKINIVKDLDHSFRRVKATTPLMASMQLPIDPEYFKVLGQAMDRIILRGTK